MIPIHFAFVPPRVGLSIASLVKTYHRAEPAIHTDNDNIADFFHPDANPTQPITDIEQWGDRYALCECTFEKLNQEEKIIDRLVVNDVVVAVSLSKDIKQTKVIGAKGAVKEYITNDDSTITFNVGVVAVENGLITDKYPLEGIRQLRQFFEDNTTVAVHSQFLDALDIDRIVFTNFECTQNTASNYQTLTLTAKEDRRYNVKAAAY